VIYRIGFNISSLLLNIFFKDAQATKVLQVDIDSHKKVNVVVDLREESIKKVLSFYIRFV
jgi:hypothetical protein